MNDKNAERTITSTPSRLATVALHALASYTAAGLAGQGDHMHEQLAKRLARVAVTNNWES